MKACLNSLIIVFLMLHAGAAAQEQDPYGNYLEERLDNRQFEKEEWEKAKEGLDFSESAVQKKGPAPVEEPGGGDEGEYETIPRERDAVQVNPRLAAGILKFLAILILAIILALILRGVLGLESNPRNKKIEHEDQERVINLEKIEENLHRADLESFILQALKQEEYALALRLYYLSILKELSQRKAIHWKREKTNRQYVWEMRQSPLSGAFEEVTRIFEQAWYGGRQMDKREYQALEPKFRMLAGKVKGG
ncbi:MAG: DUF4129 domain-containing protein [Phaeodactylibacter sp.]|nr:DUF4129 domain-containing protein [Phaeodactylibacter sp.]MCB9052603.1 DUF4129 domain-containing protein [Lewinellaceae bacterium]